MKFSFILLILLVILLLPKTQALSNESMQANATLQKAISDFQEMASRNLPLVRANESLQDAIQLYTAQLNSEISGRKINYNSTVEAAKKVSAIKTLAFQADDELKIFNQTYYEIKQNVNLSEMDEEYEKIIKSFQEERFEETIKSIDSGYKLMSEIQSKQTALNIFYKSTSATLGNFIKKNWLKFAIILAILATAGIIFRKPIRLFLINRRLKNINIKKESLNKVIKKLQTDYFKIMKISESEYHVKLSHFKEIARDLDRQLSIAKEDLLRVTRIKKSLR